MDLSSLLATTGGGGINEQTGASSGTLTMAQLQALLAQLQAAQGTPPAQTTSDPTLGTTDASGQRTTTPYMQTNSVAPVPYSNPAQRIAMPDTSAGASVGPSAAPAAPTDPMMGNQAGAVVGVGGQGQLPPGFAQMSIPDQIHYLVQNPSSMAPAASALGMGTSQFQNWFNTEADNGHTNDGSYDPTTGQYSNWYMNSGNPAAPQTGTQPATGAPPAAPTGAQLSTGDPLSTTAPLSSGDPLSDPASASNFAPLSGTATPASAAPAAGTVDPSSLNVVNPNAPNYSLNTGSYLDPSMQFTMDQGMKALNSNAAANGQLGSGQSLKDILNYSQGLATTNFNNAEQTAEQQQGFGLGANQYDQNFAYNAANNDRNFAYTAANNDRNFDYTAQQNDQTVPFNEQMQLANLGLSGANSTASINTTLAALLSGNLSTLGQVQGTGTIGQNNAITGALSSGLSSLTNQATAQQNQATLQQLIAAINAANAQKSPTTPGP